MFLHTNISNKLGILIQLQHIFLLTKADEPIMLFQEKKQLRILWLERNMN